jgi:deoxycytidylate deaminase
VTTVQDSQKRILPRVENRYAENSFGIEFLELSNRDKRFLNKALELAGLREDVDHNRHCAIAVKNGNILSVGFNRYKNEPSVLSDEHLRSVPGRNQCHGVGPHAEIDALRQVSDPKGVIIYVARALRNGEPGNSAPCGDCQIFMQNAGVKRVYWS